MPDLKGRIALKFPAMALLFIFLVPCMPVNYIQIDDSENIIAASPVLGGSAFTTEYIHSVQLTPVIDEYRILQGKIWGWEERVQSHNAGLPYDAPQRGRFIVDSPWMIIRGGGVNTDRIAYRIGTSALGKNKWRLAPFDEIKAYEEFPSKRVFITSDIRMLRLAQIIGFQTADLNKQ